MNKGSNFIQMDNTTKSVDLSLEDVCGCRPNEEKGDIPCATCLYDQSYLLRKACTLFNDTFATTMIHRHFRLLNEYIRVSQEGVLLQDLRYFIYALEFLGKSCESQLEYADILRNMLELCCLPPLMLKPVEGLSPMEEIRELFDSLGSLMAALEDLELRLNVVRTVHCLLTRHQRAHEHAVPLRLVRAAAEHSAVSLVVSQLLEFADPDLYTALVDLALLLTSFSPKCGKDLANARTIDFILLRLNPECTLKSTAEFRDPCETSSLDGVETSLLWGILRSLQLMDGSPFSRETPTSEALRCLSNCLRSAVQDGYLPGAISLMSLVLWALHLYPDLPIIKSGLADDIATLSVASELKSKEKWTETILLDRTREAFELKRLLLLSICYLARHEAVIEILREKKVIVVLLRLAEPNAVELPPWQSTLATTLADLALHALLAISVTAPLDVVKCGGLSYFLLVVESNINTQADTEKLHACFSALYYISTIQNNNYFLEEVHNTGAICIVVRFCCHGLNSPTFLYTRQHVLMKAFMVLKILFKNNDSEKEKHGEVIIELFDSFLKLVLTSNSTDLFPIDDKLIICALDFIWETLVLCESNCGRIIKKGYIYKLLDLLQISIFPVQLILLGLLVDLIEFENCIAHIITWHGNNNCAFLPLLMKIWRQEELFISPHRDSSGCITEVSLPLMGQEQWFKTYGSNKDYENSPAIVDMYASARPKIYAIIKLLKSRNKEVIEDLEEFYHVSLNLPKEDEITMQLVEKYLEMKMKEVWNETELDLSNLSIIPTEVDTSMMKILNERQFQCALDVQNQQQRLVEDIKQMELKDERNLYELTEGSNAIEKADTLQALETIECTRNPFFMNTVKQIEQKQISTIFPQHVPLTQCFNSYNTDTLSKLILHQHFNVRFRKDLELKEMNAAHSSQTSQK